MRLPMIQQVLVQSVDQPQVNFEFLSVTPQRARQRLWALCIGHRRYLGPVWRAAARLTQQIFFDFDHRIFPARDRQLVPPHGCAIERLETLAPLSSQAKWSVSTTVLRMPCDPAARGNPQHGRPGAC
jgi:hypothetical protein